MVNDSKKNCIFISYLNYLYMVQNLNYKLLIKKVCQLAKIHNNCGNTINLILQKQHIDRHTEANKNVIQIDD